MPLLVSLTMINFQIRALGREDAAGDIERALTPFGQVDSRLARKYEGTGLGLPLVKAMAELHGGMLRIDSAVGHGTTVTIRFPAERVLSPVDVAAAPQAA